MASTSKSMEDSGRRMPLTVSLFGLKTHDCVGFPKCGCADGSCGRAADKNGHLKCGLDGKISLARAEVKEAQKNQEHARMAFSEAIKTLRGIPKDSPQYGPARAHRSLMQKAHIRLSARTEETRGVLSALLTSLKHIEDREQVGQKKKADHEMTVWAKRCQKTTAPEVRTKRARRIRMGREVIRAPCGVLCADIPTMAVHRNDCEQCKTITQITGA